MKIMESLQLVMREHVMFFSGETYDKNKNVKALKGGDVEKRSGILKKLKSSKLFKYSFCFVFRFDPY